MPSLSQKPLAPPAQDPDVLLMHNVQKGDTASFETLMRKYYARVFAFAYRMTLDRALADDVSQEVFIRVYRAARNWRPEARFSTWLFTIAKNTTLNEIRRTRRMVRLDAVSEDGGAISQTDDSPRAAAQRSERAARVRAAIQNLPEHQRAAVILRRYERLSYEDIAGTLGVSVSAVKSLLNRAKQSLRKSLRDYI